jgi:hypothetical protein
MVLHDYFELRKVKKIISTLGLNYNWKVLNLFNLKNSFGKDTARAAAIAFDL